MRRIVVPLSLVLLAALIGTLLFTERESTPNSVIAEPAVETEKQPLEAPSIATDDAADRETAAAPSERTSIAPTTESSDAAAKDRGRIVRVRVLDFRREPAAGVPVVLTAESGASSVGSEMVYATREGGIALLYESNLRQTFGTVAKDATFRIGVYIPLRKPIGRALRFDDLFAETIELVLPPLGAVDVVVVRDGVRVRQPLDVWLKLSMESHGELGEPVRWPIPRAIVDEGVARFPWVETGLRFFASATVASETISAPTSFAGPTNAGELVTYTLDLERTPYFAFRLLDPAGEIVTSESLDAYRFEGVKNGPAVSIGAQVTTDERGNAEVRWPEPWKEGMRRVLSISRTADEPSLGVATAKIDLSREPSPGRNDLGDVRLEPPPLLVAGQVVGPTMKPVANAGVRIVTVKPGVDSDSPGAPSDSEGEPRIRTDADGRFAIREESHGMPFTLEASALGFAPSERVAADPGQGNVTLMLRQGGSVRATVKRPAFLDALYVTARLFSAAERAKNRRSVPPRQRAICTDDGLLAFRDLVPGTYVLEISAGPLDPVVTIGDVIVRGGEETNDRRLQDIDLTGGLRQVDVSVVDTAGHPIGICEVTPVGARDAPPGRWVREGVFRLVIDARGQSIVVRAGGCRATVVEDVKSDVRVVVQPAITVVIRARGTGPLAKGDHSLQLQLAPGEFLRKALPAALLEEDPRTGAFGSDRMARFLVDAPGPYEVTWVFCKSAANYGMSTTVGDPVSVDVRESLDPQTIEVDVPASALDLLGG